MPRKSRLLVVANRLPLTRAGSPTRPHWMASTGGLVSALRPALQAREGEWIGWSGHSDRAPRHFESDGIVMRPVALTESDVDGFYNHISNRTFWPLYHDAIRTPEFDHRWWPPYVQVNRRYAALTAKVAKPGDLVWVHDYHLQLVPAMLRKLRPDLRIGFFLHIPFPPEELFAWLPWRQHVLNGLLGADVIGFQTSAWARNFSRAARDYTEATGTDTELVLRKRRITVGSFPISIDFKEFDTAAHDEGVQARAATIRERVGADRTMLLSVDRLDYTKGIDARLLAFEMLLKSKRITVNDCVLVQVAVPSRESANDYAEMRTRVEQIVGRINGEYSEPGRVAVHYFRRSLPRDEVVAYYRAADVMVVTPLRDGMNLVAKEYIATRFDRSGVLVLSEFAGAAEELKRALLVNPRDIEGMADAMHNALTMPRREARLRMAILRTIVRRHDVHEWAENFLGTLADG